MAGGATITCSMCGNDFDPTNQAACAACPLVKNCSLVRCPVCGFETVDPRSTVLGNLAKRLLNCRADAKKPTQETIR